MNYKKKQNLFIISVLETFAMAHTIVVFRYIYFLSKTLYDIMLISFVYCSFHSEMKLFFFIDIALQMVNSIAFKTKKKKNIKNLH